MAIVYEAINIINNKRYIGKTIKSLAVRKIQHEKSSSTKGFHGALKKYGIDNFKWNVLFETDNNEILAQKEIEYINLLRTFVGFEDSNGYNRTLGGDGASPGDANVSKRQTTRNKLRKASLGKIPSTKTKEKISSTLTGRKLSSEHIENIRNGVTNLCKPKGDKHPQRKFYYIIYPNGKEELIKGLRDFCRTNNLNAKLLRRVAKGLQESHKGYKCKFYEED